MNILGEYSQTFPGAFAVDAFVLEYALFVPLDRQIWPNRLLAEQ
jgi:hypothetical protein